MLFSLYIACCLFLIALLSLILVALYISRRLSEQVGVLFSDDISHLHKKEEHYRKKYPDNSPEEIVQRVIKGEALNSGIVGFITGLGGLITLPIALPIDIFATIRIQYRLVEYLISKEKQNNTFIDVERIKVMAVVSGSSRLTEAGSKALIAVLTKYAPRIVLKGVPILGGIIGFLIDYFGTRAVAKFALKESAQKVTAQIESTTNQTLQSI